MSDPSPSPPPVPAAPATTSAPGEVSHGEGYLHGFDSTEQERLFSQARFLEERVFAGFDFSHCRHLLEVGCGVGAQTEILLRRFPRARITAVDLSASQLARARSHFAGRPEDAARVRFVQADAISLPDLGGDAPDGAYLCWVLEHAANPLALLRELRSKLAPGGLVCIAEVFNHTLHLEPRLPVLERYWQAYNSLQTELGGSPNVGVRLGSLLTEAGFQDIRVWPNPLHYDRRASEERRAMLDYWLPLLLSGAPALLNAGRITPTDAEELERGLKKARESEDTIFYYSFMKAVARG